MLLLNVPRGQTTQAVVTDCQSILSLDLADCKKEQLQFKSEFVLTARRNDFVHAIVAYFDCQFSQVGGRGRGRGPVREGEAQTVRRFVWA